MLAEAMGVAPLEDGASPATAVAEQPLPPAPPAEIGGPNWSLTPGPGAMIAAAATGAGAAVANALLDAEQEELRAVAAAALTASEETGADLNGSGSDPTAPHPAPGAETSEASIAGGRVEASSRSGVLADVPGTSAGEAAFGGVPQEGFAEPGSRCAYLHVVFPGRCG